MRIPLVGQSVCRVRLSRTAALRRVVSGRLGGWWDSLPACSFEGVGARRRLIAEDKAERVGCTMAPDGGGIARADEAIAGADLE